MRERDAQGKRGIMACIFSGQNLRQAAVQSALLVRSDFSPSSGGVTDHATPVSFGKLGDWQPHKDSDFLTDQHAKTDIRVLVTQHWCFAVGTAHAGAALWVVTASKESVKIWSIMGEFIYDGLAMWNNERQCQGVRYLGVFYSEATIISRIKFHGLFTFQEMRLSGDSGDTGS